MGSYTEHIALVDWQEAEFQLQTLLAQPKPSWLVYDNAENLLFAVEEDADCGKLHSYRLRSPRHSRCLGAQVVLERLDSINTGGCYPCHILHIADRQQLCLTNYMGGPVSIVTYQNSGRLSWVRTIQHRISGNPAVRHNANSERQGMSHPHSCILAPDKKGLFCADLGYDQVNYHSLDLGEREKAIVANLPVGYGPRHMCLSADGSLLYVLCELEPYLLSFQLQEQGQLKQLSACRITQQAVRSQCSEICRHPSLPCLYAANRNAGYVAQIQNGPDGELEFAAEFALASSNPRHIAISPDGRFLFAALQDSDQVQVFTIEPVDGSLLVHSFIPFTKPAFINFISQF